MSYEICDEWLTSFNFKVWKNMILLTENVFCVHRHLTVWKPKSYRIFLKILKERSFTSTCHFMTVNFVILYYHTLCTFISSLKGFLNWKEVKTKVSLLNIFNYHKYYLFLSFNEKLDDRSLYCSAFTAMFSFFS